MIQLFLRLCLVTFLALLFMQCQTDSGKIELTLTNNSSIDLTDKAISIERSQLSEIPQGEVFPLIISPKCDTIAAQLDDLNGDKIWDELFFVADIPGNVESSYSLEWVKDKPDFPVKTSVRFGKRMAEDIPVKPAHWDIHQRWRLAAGPDMPSGPY